MNSCFSDIINPLVAESVMGWTRLVCRNNEEGRPFYANYWVDQAENKIKPVNFWSPATDIKDTMDVVDQLRSEHGILIKMESTLHGEYKVSYDHDDIEAVSKSVPLAICITALRAMDVEIDDCYLEVK